MKKRIYIEGMSCNHCVKHVEEAFKEIKGIDNVFVSLEEKYADITFSGEIDDSTIKEAIEDAGYDVSNISY